MRIQESTDKLTPAVALVGMVAIPVVRLAFLDETQHVRFRLVRLFPSRVLVPRPLGKLAPAKDFGGVFRAVFLNFPFECRNSIQQPGVKNRHSSLAKRLPLHLILLRVQFRQKLFRAVWLIRALSAFPRLIIGWR